MMDSVEFRKKLQELNEFFDAFKLYQEDGQLSSLLHKLKALHDNYPHKSYEPSVAFQEDLTDEKLYSTLQFKIYDAITQAIETHRTTDHEDTATVLYEDTVNPNSYDYIIRSPRTYTLEPKTRTVVSTGMMLTVPTGWQAIITPHDSICSGRSHVWIEPTVISYGKEQEVRLAVNNTHDIRKVDIPKGKELASIAVIEVKKPKGFHMKLIGT